MSILLNTQGWQGDYVLGSTVNILFSTSSPAAGQASPLISGVVALYKNTSAAYSGSGITLTAQTSGLNLLSVNTAVDLNFFQTRTDYTAVLQAGTVSGFSVSGIVIGSFSLINRSDNLIITQNGTASAGASNSITLQANASSVPSFYNNQTVVLTIGTGAGQSAVIQSYASGTHIATITGTWATAPASGTGYVVYGGGINTANVQQINNAVAVTSSAQIGVNVVTIGPASASTSSAQFGVNVVTVGGGVPNLLVNGLFPASASGGSISTVTTLSGGVNVAQINTISVATSSAQLGVNVVTVGQSAAITSSAQFGVNIVTVGGAIPNPLVTGLFPASTSGGAISTVANITSGVNVTQWLGVPPNPLVTGLVPSATSGGSISVVASVTSGVNVTQWLGSPPNVLVSGLVATSASGGSVGNAGTIANITSGVNLTQWLGSTPNPLIAGLVAASASGGSVFTVANITSGVNVSLWQGAQPAPLVQSLVQAQVSGTPTVVISQSFPANFSSLAITSGTGLVTVGTNNDKTGYSLTSGEETNIANAVWDQASGIETNVTPRQALRYTAAANVGVTTGALTTTFTISAISAAGTTRITATTDGSGNRSAVVLS